MSRERHVVGSDSKSRLGALREREAHTSGARVGVWALAVQASSLRAFLVHLVLEELVEVQY